MKKLIILLAILCLAGVAVVACTAGKAPAAPAAEVETPADAAEPVEDAAEPADTEPVEDAAPTDAEETQSLDLEALYALHDPDEIVMTIDGEEIPWRDYFYFYQSHVAQLEQQFQMYQAYGYALGWNSPADEEGHTYAELVGTEVENAMRQILGVEALAKDLNVQLTEEEQAEMQQNHRDLITARFGEEGTEEQLYEFLDSLHVSPELYWRINSYSYLLDACMREVCGKDGELLDEQEVLDWMEENGILSANHILISTTDLDESAKAEKSALARQIAEELQAIEGVEERIARFLELQEQYNEDPGTVEKGYVFGPGVMVPEFYDGALALEENQVSDPVESQFGYHIILRRPLHAEDEIYTGGYSNSTARVMAASERFSALMDGKIESQQVVYAEGFTAPDLAAYLPSDTSEK